MPLLLLMRVLLLLSSTAARSLPPIPLCLSLVLRGSCCCMVGVVISSIQWIWRVVECRFVRSNSL